MHLFDLFYKLSAMEFGKIVYMRKHCPMMSGLKKVAYVVKVICEPLVLYKLGELDYRFYDGENTVQLQIFSYIQLAFVLVVSLFI